MIGLLLGRREGCVLNKMLGKIVGYLLGHIEGKFGGCLLGIMLGLLLEIRKVCVLGKAQDNAEVACSRTLAWS